MRRAILLLHPLVSLALLACSSSSPTAAPDPDAAADSTPAADADSAADADAAADSAADSAADAAADSAADAAADSAADAAPDSAGWPAANVYSWNGSWSPADSDFPLSGLYDDVYFDGHAGSDGKATPILPPGAWDWGGAPNLANWRNFSTNIGAFAALRDAKGRAFGWRVVGVKPDAIPWSGAAEYFEGSSGTDVVDLGAAGDISSISGSLGDGPDVLVAATSHSLDFRTGSSLAPHAHDDDLLVLGCAPHADGAFAIRTSSYHAGPGRDWVFVRDVSAAAIDLGNGEGGKTVANDPSDGDDLVVLRGNTHDFRVFGGSGRDTFVWYVDENVQTTTWLGPNFFGGGGDDAALWSDGGVDRLVLAVPTTTTLVTTTPTPKGALLVKPTTGALVEDAPTQADPYARYCVECGTGPKGEKTIILEYVSATGAVKTGYFYLTAIEELQIGVGAGARVYALDGAKGTATLDATKTPYAPPRTPTCGEAAAAFR